MARPLGRTHSKQTRRKIGRTVRLRHQRRRDASAHAMEAMIDTAPRALPPDTFGDRQMLKHLRHDPQELA